MELTTEELIRECQRRGLKIEKPKEGMTFKVVVRYDRGLGAEYINLHDVTAKNIAEAQQQAEEMASLHFLAHYDEDTVINQVRISPHE